MNSSPFRHFRAVLILGVAFLAWSLRAQDTNRYVGSHWALLDAKKILAAADITLEKYPDCDDATVDGRSVRVYHPDGTAEAQDETFTKVLTEKGKRKNRTLEMGFMLPYNTVEVTRLEVIKPGGEVVPIDVAANSKETIDESQMSMNIYDPNAKILKVNLPKVEIGDVVHSVIRSTTLRSIIPGEWTEISLFEQPSYIRHLAYEVHAPKEKELKCIKLRDPIKGTVTYEKQTTATGDLIHHWEARDVPRMFDEPGMPSYERVVQRLMISTLPDWQTVSKWYWDLSRSHLEATTTDLNNQVAELTAGMTNGADKVKALFYFVSKKIRYMGLTPEKDRPGFEPHDVSLTFDKKYGVCRDKAALLVAMLRTAGLDAYPVLINVGTRRDEEVPDPNFNHAIVGVELKKGEYTLMDPTDENTRELLPDGDRNQSYLVCRPEGERIFLSPIQPADENLMRVKTTGTLNNAGALEAKTELWFDGVNDNAYRNAFAQMKPDDKRRFFEGYLKRALPGVKLTSLKLMPEDMADMTTAVRAVMEFSVDGMTATGNGKAVVNLPWVGKHFGIINFILGGTGLEKRKYPLETSVACGLQEEVSLKLGDGFTGAVSLPVCTPINNTNISYAEQVAFAGKRLAASRELKLKVVEFSPEEYLKLKKTLEILQYDERKTPLLALSGSTTTAAPTAVDSPAPAVESNAEVLYSRKEITIQDAHSSTYNVKYSKRILTYLGKKREAEVKIAYNPACESARLIRGVVIAKSGQRQEISPDEINLMDAGSNASAKRYTGDKILVANLPGVEIGSTIEVEFELTTKGKPFLAGYEAFQMPDQLDYKMVQLTAPAGIVVQNHVSGTKGAVKTETASTNDNRVFIWTAEKVAALPAEQQLPPEWTYAAGVSYFAGDAGDYWKELHRVMQDRAGRSTKAGETARQLTKSAKTKLEALTAIRDFTAKAIRLAGPNFIQLPLSELSAADTTLADGYGHIADRAILLHALLTAAGFEPEFVMASMLPPITPITEVTSRFPLPQNFDSPLVRVTLDGETYYLNDTDQYSQPGTTAHNGRLAIQLASGAFETVKAAKDCGNKTDIIYSLALDDKGNARVGIRKLYYGPANNDKKRFFSELPPEERNRYFQEAVSAVAQGARPVGGLTTTFDRYPGVEEFTVEIDHYGVVDGNNLYFDLPYRPSLFATTSNQRTLPLFMAGTSDRSIRADIQLPPMFQHLVIAPGDENLALPAGGGGAVVTRTNSANHYTITCQLENHPAIISPSDYASVLNLESALGKKSKRVFLLEKGR